MRPTRPLLIGLAILALTAAGCGPKAAKTPLSQAGPQKPPEIPKTEPPKTDVDSLLAEVRRDVPIVQGGSTPAMAAVRQHIPPDHPRRREVFKTLLEIGYAKKDPNDRQVILTGAIRFAGKDEIPDLFDMLKRGESFRNDLRFTVYDRLAEIKDPSCVDEVVKGLKPGIDQYWMQISVKVLKAVGPPAEPAVRPYALPEMPPGAKNDIETRVAAIDVLGEVGNDETVAFLEALPGAEAGMIMNARTAAIKKIRGRKK